MTPQNPNNQEKKFDPQDPYLQKQSQLTQRTGNGPSEEVDQQSSEKSQKLIHNPLQSVLTQDNLEFSQETPTLQLPQDSLQPLTPQDQTMNQLPLPTEEEMSFLSGQGGTSKEKTLQDISMELKSLDPSNLLQLNEFEESLRSCIKTDPDLQCSQVEQDMKCSTGQLLKEEENSLSSTLMPSLLVPKMTLEECGKQELSLKEEGGNLSLKECDLSKQNTTESGVESRTSLESPTQESGKKVKKALSEKEEMLTKEKRRLTRELNAVKRELSALGYRESVSVHRTKGKGNKFELQMVKLLKELGPEFAFAKSARAGSRVLDNCGIDIIDIPMIIQSKAGKQTGIKPAELIKYIDDQMKQLLPPSSEWHGKIRAVVHFDDSGTGIARSEYHDLAYLTVSDFLKLLKMAFVK